MPELQNDGTVVVWGYPWDGCSFDEEPCKFCNCCEEWMSEYEGQVFQPALHPAIYFP